MKQITFFNENEENLEFKQEKQNDDNIFIKHSCFLSFYYIFAPFK